MVSKMFLILSCLISLTANAQLAERYEYRQEELRTRSAQKAEQDAIDSAYAIVEAKAKAKIVGSPQVEIQSDQTEWWYFRMTDNQICSIAIKRSAGRVIFAFASSAGCVQD